MKYEKIKLFWVIMLLFSLSILTAQQVDYEGRMYDVKGNKIFFDGKEVTKSLSFEQQIAIKNKNSERLLADRKLREAEKAAKKAAKKQKAAEKKVKKAEKEIKQKEHAEKKYSKARNSLDKNIKSTIS
ncbi:hypothetical protein [Lutibacter sp.]|uniref:hypothetical protein n=1 Tax=Lutibacter sp. TaxID=1925666 RepID=UPI00273350D0|nr:hypothetical protein [Lutibacter sp.]MDP3314362.1 hypothetical protein [Lutibacter sp.]